MAIPIGASPQPDEAFRMLDEPVIPGARRENPESSLLRLQARNGIPAPDHVQGDVFHRR